MKVFALANLGVRFLSFDIRFFLNSWFLVKNNCKNQLTQLCAIE